MIVLPGGSPGGLLDVLTARPSDSAPSIGDRLIALHARGLAFHHPMTREPVDVTAPLGDDWRELAAVGVDLGPDAVDREQAGEKCRRKKTH